MQRALPGSATMVSLASIAILLNPLEPAPLPAQEASPTFRVSADLVLADVQVLQKKTHTPAASLRAEDLRIFEDGMPQEIRHFSRDELPLSVVLLFDLTMTSRPVLKNLAEGAKAALMRLKPADEVSVMVYSENARVVDGFSTDRDRSAHAIAQAAGMSSSGNAYFNEAMYRAAMQLHESTMHSGRRAVIWLTDGAPDVPFHTRNPVHSEAEAFRALHEEGVVVLSTLLEDPKMLPVYLLLGAIEGPFAKAHPPGSAKKYAELTGGQSMNLQHQRSGELLAELIDELRACYTIGYRPTDAKPAGTFCKLRVDLAREGSLRPAEWVVLARQGYYRR